MADRQDELRADTVARMWARIGDVNRDELCRRFGKATVEAALTGAGSLRMTQLPPPGDWSIWAILAGRGFGKTLAGAEWVHALAAEAPRHFALVGTSLENARAVMVEGESGLLARVPAGGDVSFVPSLRQLTWQNGSQARPFSGGEPDSLRGGQFDFAWGDEFAHWSRAEATLANLRLATRLWGLANSGSVDCCVDGAVPSPQFRPMWQESVSLCSTRQLCWLLIRRSKRWAGSTGSEPQALETRLCRQF